MNEKDKIVILNGKRFLVGHSKIKSNKCYVEKKKKKQIKKLSPYARKKNIVLCRKRPTNRTSRKRREIKDKNE